uniref:F-box domain-containing protein n=1 Tax=Plectus sambesii TaxID=2011161 RepID=A0A914WEP5_9BILA
MASKDEKKALAAQKKMLKGNKTNAANSNMAKAMAAPEAEGAHPDNSLDYFSEIHYLPFIKVLRFLPARQVAQMRLVSDRFDYVITRSSHIMPKKKIDDTVVFKSNDAGELIVEWIDDSDKKIIETTLAGDQVALSELLRFIHIGGTMFFSDAVSAADKVLNQLSTAWLTIRPKSVIFSGDLSQTSRDSLRAFLVKVEPSIKRLHFQYAKNISHNLLSDNVIRAAGRLDGLMVMPWDRNPALLDINIGDETRLAMADADHMPSYFCVMGCSGITPGDIRAFVEEWMAKEGPEEDGKYNSCKHGMELCQLAFYKCANVMPAVVEEALKEMCGDLLKKETIAAAGTEEMKERVQYAIQCRARNCRLEIHFHYYVRADFCAFGYHEARVTCRT